MIAQPILRISRTDLENLMSSLAVEAVSLAACAVGERWRISLAASDLPIIIYGGAGNGRVSIGGQPPIDLKPHTLVIVPQGQSVSVEMSAERRAIWGRPWSGQVKKFERATLEKFDADEGGQRLELIVGYFSAAFGSCISLFGSLSSPIVEDFDVVDHLDDRLRAAVDELSEQEVGASAMTTALLKQVLVVLLRRSLKSTNGWVERFSLLSDPQIARAFSEMVVRPGAAHCVNSLSQKVGLSRSVFMARFTAAFGCSPMAILRQLRMRHAAELLTTSHLSIDQVSFGVGYASRSSFFRAFRKAYGSDPTDYRASALRTPDRNRVPYTPAGTVTTPMERREPVLAL
jgi:AraC-like DNA-binding protein